MSNRFLYSCTCSLLASVGVSLLVVPQALADGVVSEREPVSPISIDAVTADAAAADAVTADAVSVDAVAAYLVGVMDTTAQAERDPNFVGVQMTTCRVAMTGSVEDDSAALYLYQEQALTEDLAVPYRQRFLQLVPGANNRIESRTFKPANEEAWVGLCDRADRSVPASTLGESVCTVSLRPSSIGGFVGSTPAAGCPANMRGAVSITNVVVLHAEGMDTWDRGFDAEGNQLWGAEEVPYRYRR